MARDKGCAETLDFRSVDVQEALREHDRRPGTGPLHRRRRHGSRTRRSGRPLRPGEAGAPHHARPAHALREAILACRKGGTVSIAGVYAGLAVPIPGARS